MLGKQYIVRFKLASHTGLSILDYIYLFSCLGRILVFVIGSVRYIVYFIDDYSKNI